MSISRNVGTETQMIFKEKLMEAFAEVQRLIRITARENESFRGLMGRIVFRFESDYSKNLLLIDDAQIEQIK